MAVSFLVIRGNARWSIFPICRLNPSWFIRDHVDAWCFWDLVEKMAFPISSRRQTPPHTFPNCFHFAWTLLRNWWELFFILNTKDLSIDMFWPWRHMLKLLALVEAEKIEAGVWGRKLFIFPLGSFVRLLILPCNWRPPTQKYYVCTVKRDPFGSSPDHSLNPYPICVFLI